MGNDRYNPKLGARVRPGDVPRWILRHSRSDYILAVLRATPSWCHWSEVRRIHRAARERKGDWVVDHVIPLNHPRVCGLNVPANLRIVPHAVNARKNNAWCEWHGELFTEPEQFRLEGL